MSNEITSDSDSASNEVAWCLEYGLSARCHLVKGHEGAHEFCELPPQTSVHTRGPYAAGAGDCNDQAKSAGDIPPPGKRGVPGSGFVREAYAWRRRQEGLTYRQIGEILRIVANGARALVLSFERHGGAYVARSAPRPYIDKPHPDRAKFTYKKRKAVAGDI
jgi:hypothetical protein